MAARASQRLTACKDYTHMLAIPTITQTSRVHLRSSFAQFEHDTSMLIPEGAVRNPELLDIRIGLLNIPTPEHMEIYTECLLRPDVHKVLRHAAAAVAPLISTNPKEFGRPHICGQTQDIQPLKIDLRGCTTPKLQFNTSFLWAQVIDSTHRLQHFFHSIQKHFKNFGLLHKPFDPKVSIVNTWLMTWGAPPNFIGRGSRRRMKRSCPRFDARDLLETHKDVIWVKDIQLERLMVTERGNRLKGPRDSDSRVVEKMATIIDSIALP